MTSAEVRNELDQGIVELLKVRKHLHFSLDKSKRIDLSLPLSMDDAVYIESCFSRFETVIELVFGGISKSIELIETGQNEGTTKDRILLLEKLGLVEGWAEDWIAMRQLRNKIAHVYLGSDYQQHFDMLLDFMIQRLEPFVVKLIEYSK